MKLSNQFIEEINSFETIYCLVSGGYHSTASALLLKDYGFENVILLHNKTLLEMKSSIKTLKLLQEKTNYEYIETIPDLKGETIWDILKRSFKQIPQMRKDVENGKYGHSNIECCNILKKYPAKRFFKTINKNNSVIISSICRFESNRRFQWLNQYKKENTFLHLKKKAGNVWYAYPFRDITSKKIFLPYLKLKGFDKIRHSGCSICPILIIFKMYKEDRYYYSSKAAIRAGLPCFQKTIQDYLEV